MKTLALGAVVLLAAISPGLAEPAEEPNLDIGLECDINSPQGAVGNDFDGDGNADMLWKNRITEEYKIWFMDGTDRREVVSIGVTPLPWQVVAVEDYNGDCRADILWRDTASGDVIMWLMNVSWVIENRKVAWVPLKWRVVTGSQRPLPERVETTIPLPPAY